MYCPNCPAVTEGEEVKRPRMMCVFTAPIATCSRYRVYRCPVCRHYEDTYETLTKLLPPTTEQTQTLRNAIEAAKLQRFRFSRKDKKGAPTTASGELTSGWQGPTN